MRVHTTIRINKKIKEEAKKAGVNLSKFVEVKLKEFLSQQGIEVEEENDPLVIRVRCPSCGFEQNTTTIRTVQCIKCGMRYQVYRKKGMSRIVDIVKGTKEELFKMYYKIYKK